MRHPKTLIPPLPLNDRDILRHERLERVSSKSINVFLLEGSQEVTRLDAMMQNLYRRHPAKLHVWLAASRVERSPQRKKDTGTSTVDTSAPLINRQ